LDVIEYAKQGKWSANPDGNFKPEHTYWRGFPNRTAAGLRLEHAAPGSNLERLAVPKR